MEYWKIEIQRGINGAVRRRSGSERRRIVGMEMSEVDPSIEEIIGVVSRVCHGNS